MDWRSVKIVSDSVSVLQSFTKNEVLWIVEVRLLLLQTNLTLKILEPLIVYQNEVTTKAKFLL